MPKEQLELEELEHLHLAEARLRLMGQVALKGEYKFVSYI